MKRLYILLLAIVITCCLSFRDSYDPVVAYIDQYKSMAIAEMNRTGIPASIKLAQAVVETDSGRSILATRAKNHFGIKCKSYWEGPRYFYTDDDRDEDGNLVPSCFRMYDSVEESFRDHSEFLLYSGRYDMLFKGGEKDYVFWATGLQQCGYATDSNYSKRLMAIIERYDLNTLDNGEGQ